MSTLLYRLVKKIVGDRPYDAEIDHNYMLRWFLLPRNRLCNIYYHQFIGSDAPIPHDHPWVSMSIVLKGQYIEHTPQGSHTRKEGHIGVRGAKSMHWIEISETVHTLFITGPRTRNWGFQCEDRWVSHDDYIRRRGSDRLANGCGEKA